MLHILAALAVAVEPVLCAKLEKQPDRDQTSTEVNHVKSSVGFLAPNVAADLGVLHHPIEDKLDPFQSKMGDKRRNLLQQQLGADFDGAAAEDKLGSCVAISDDGATVAFTAPFAQASGVRPGYVYVHKYSSNSWTALGAPITVDPIADVRIEFVSLSQDGSMLAFATGSSSNPNECTVEVHSYNSGSNSWTQVGSDIDAETATRCSSVSLSSDGSVVAVGSSSASSYKGRVKVYESSSNVWALRGSAIEGAADDDQDGYSVSLSGDGMRLATNAYGYNSNQGRTRIYAFDSNDWALLGSPITGEDASDWDGMGSSNQGISLSRDGSRVAISSTRHGSIGHVRVFTYNTGTSQWEQLGASIDGETGSTGHFPAAVSLSNDGTTLAAGAALHRDSNNLDIGGRVRIFKYSGSGWTQTASIDGAASSDMFGASLALSGDGSRVVIGGKHNDDGGNKAGHAQVHDLPVTCAANEKVSSNACVACPSGTTNTAGDDASGSDTECTASSLPPTTSPAPPTTSPTTPDADDPWLVTNSTSSATHAHEMHALYAVLSVACLHML